MEVSQLHDLDTEFEKLISITEHEISKTIDAAKSGKTTTTIATYIPSIEKPPPNIALPIPPPISPYLSLTFLDVSNLTDSFPEWLPECVNLTHLIAANHQLTVLPSFVSERLTKLQVVDLSWNRLSEWPIQLARLPDLKVLNLEGNPFFVRLVEHNPRIWVEYNKSSSGDSFSSNGIDRMHTATINPTLSKKAISTTDSKRKTSWFSRRKSVAVRQAKEEPSESDEDEGVLTSLGPISSLSCTTTDSVSTSSTSSFASKPKYKVSKTLQHKSSVIIPLLRDIYELVTKEPPAEPEVSDIKSIDVHSSKISVHSSSSSSTSASLITLTTAINAAIEEEKNYVTKLGEFQSIYLQSKKLRATKNEHLQALLAPFTVFHQFHSSVMLGGLQRFKVNQNYTQLAQSVAAHIDIFRIYYHNYVIDLEKRHELVTFLKRVSDIETSNSDMNGSHMNQITRSKWYREAEWVQNCVRKNQHTSGIGEYLQLPVIQLTRYRILFRKLARLEHTLTENSSGTQEPKILVGINEQLDKIFKDIENKKPQILQKRRLADFDRAYNLRSKIPENRDRMYLGDASMLLQREVTLLGGMHVDYTVHKTKFNLALYRVIVCDDVVVVIDEDKRKVAKMAIRNNARITQHGHTIRIAFSASSIWHGTLRAFYGDYFKPKP